jgi:hypothetical protein
MSRPCDTALQLHHLPRLRVRVSTTRNVLHHAPPEHALLQRHAAATGMLIDDPAVPEVHQLSGTEESVDLLERATQQGRAAPSGSGDVQHLHFIHAGSLEVY